MSIASGHLPSAPIRRGGSKQRQPKQVQPVGLPFGLRAQAIDLYTISIANQPIRRYGDKVADERSGSMSAIVFGCALVALALFLLRRPRTVRRA